MDLIENNQNIPDPGIRAQEEEVQKFADMVKSAFKPVQLEGVIGLRELLLNNSDDDDLIPQIVKTGILPKLLELTSCEDDNELQLESAWCFVNICTGDEVVQEIVELGGLDISIKLLDSCLEGIVHHGLWIISTIIETDPTYAGLCCEKGCMPKLLEALDRFPTSDTIIKDFLWAICILTQEKTCEKITSVYFNSDEYSKFFEKEHPELVHKLFGLISHRKPGIRKKVIVAINNIVVQNEKQMEMIIQNDSFLSALISIANMDIYDIAMKAAWVILNMIAGGTSEHINRLVKHENEKILEIFSIILTGSPDIEMLKGVLEAVKRILETGRCDSENKYVKEMKKFDLVSIIEKLSKNKDLKNEADSILEYFLVEK